MVDHRWGYLTFDVNYENILNMKNINQLWVYEDEKF